MTRPMKDSGIEWIGDSPENWDVMFAFQIFEQVKNKNTGTKDSNLLSLSYGKIKRKNIDTVEGLLPETFENYNVIDKDDIVLRLTDLQNDHRSLRVGLSSEKGIITSAYITLRNKSVNNPKYLYYFLHSFDIAKGFYSMGAGVRQGLNWEELKHLSILSPDRTEQDSIVAFLDECCSIIDCIIEKTKSSIEEYKILRQAIITQAVTKGVRGDRPMKDSGIEWIGEIPAEWKVCKFKHIICKKIDNRGRTPELLDNNNGIPLVEVASLGKKHPDLSAVKKYISKESHDEYIRDDVQVGDLLITTVGATIGKCSIVDVPCFCIAQNLVGYRVNSNNYPLFWYYYIQSNVLQDMFALYGKGNTINTVKISNMEQGSIVVASYDEQFQIAEHLDKKCAEIDSLIIKKEQFLTEFENYKKAMIYEYVTGKKEVKV